MEENCSFQISVKVFLQTIFFLRKKSFNTALYMLVLLRFLPKFGILHYAKIQESDIEQLAGPTLIKKKEKEKR